MAKLTKEKVVNCLTGTTDKVTKGLKGGGLTLATLAGVIGGVILGIALRTRESIQTFLYVISPFALDCLLLYFLKNHGQNEKSCTSPM